ncbi:MAG: DNA-directed RNA polymerase, partial [Candidatus Dormibacteraceae bacterium]
MGKSDEWAGCDKPWQALAAIMDWVSYMDTSKAGKPYQSHAVVAVDGTCNGLQHLSAMTGDDVVGSHVNLAPGDKPQDIYQFVGERLFPKLQRLSKARTKEGKLAKYWVGLAVDGKLPRKLLKLPVMILAYSATKTAFKKYTRETLDGKGLEVGLDPKPPRTGDAKADLQAWIIRTQRINLFVRLIWDTIQENLPRQMKAMQWLQDCAKLASEGNQPIYWMTPDGFVVRHFYGKLSPKWVRTNLDGQVHRLKLWEPTKELDGAKQRLGISPNFVHSLDAAAARGCIIRAEEEGHVTAFASVHDSFGTHAADMERLYDYLRLAFVDVHAVGALQRFRLACLVVMRDEMMARLHVDYLAASEMADEKLPSVPDMGDLRLEEVLH